MVSSSGMKFTVVPIESGEAGGLDAQEGGELKCPASLLHMDGVVLWGGLLNVADEPSAESQPCC